MLQEFVRARLHNFHITATTFCSSERVTRPAQIQGGGDIDSACREEVLQNHISKVSAYWGGKTLWPLNFIRSNVSLLYP